MIGPFSTDVHTLVSSYRDKAQLTATVGSYSEKLNRDFEDLDRISIQADMWRSKYMASRYVV